MDTFQKQPWDVEDYEVDMTDYFEDLDGDTVSSVAVTVSPVGLTLGPGSHPDYTIVAPDNVKFRVWVGGGTDKLKYTVTCQVTTTDGRQKEHEFSVKVKETN